VATELQRLLDAEARASAKVEAAKAEREALIERTLREVAEAEARFEASRADLRAPYLKEADAHAEQLIAELNRKYEERQHSLRDLARRHEVEAVEAAVAMLLDPGQ